MLHRLEVGYMAFLDPVTGQGNGTIVIGLYGWIAALATYWNHTGELLEVSVPRPCPLSFCINWSGVGTGHEYFCNYPR